MLKTKNARNLMYEKISEPEICPNEYEAKLFEAIKPEKLRFYAIPI